MTMLMVMQPVTVMPPSRGRKGYAEQAEQLRAELITSGSPMIIARDTSRNPLETLGRYLKDFKDVAVLVATDEKDDNGKGTSFALYAEYRPTDR